jgi:uncharacterized membrane protein YGL010W
MQGMTMLASYRAWFFDQLAMYAAYHRDRRNQLTHHVGVPVIVFSLLLALTQVSLGQIGKFDVTLAVAVLAVLLLTCIAAVPIIGILTAVFYVAVLSLASYLAMFPAGTVWTLAVATFVAGWAIQFVGHAFEGRRPALTVNAVQIFMAAPFLIAEMLFAVGIEKELEATLRLRSTKYVPRDAAHST